MMQFPQNFLWGAATSAYQVEGNNPNSDWWEWEKKVGKEPSGDACKHYELFEQDFDLAQQLNHNAHRLSVEWARIEPREGEFSPEVIKHYVDVVVALRSRHIEPMVTLHHFTNPIWFNSFGGWESRRSVDSFLKFTKAIVEALAPFVRYWITINEPTIYSSHSYIFGHWPPQGTSFLRAKKVQDNQIRAHIAAYKLINSIYKDKALPKPAISISQHMSAIMPCTNTLRNRLGVYLRDKLFNYWILDRLLKEGTLDFIGLNYYSRHVVETKDWSIDNILRGTCEANHNPVKKNSLGWDIYPDGLYMVLMKLHKRYHLPLVITENGICTLNDEERSSFILGHVKAVYRAMQDGAKVQGYLYWSLLDNFEWAFGYGPRFGLIDVDYQTQKRTIKNSAKIFGEICKTGRME